MDAVQCCRRPPGPPSLNQGEPGQEFKVGMDADAQRRQSESHLLVSGQHGVTRAVLDCVDLVQKIFSTVVDQ